VNGSIIFNSKQLICIQFRSVETVTFIRGANINIVNLISTISLDNFHQTFPGFSTTLCDGYQ